MTRTLPVLVGAAIATLLALVVPAIALLAMAVGSDEAAPASDRWGTLESPGVLLWRTLAWCTTIGLVSAVIGWAISPVLRHSRGALAIMAATVPLLGPAIVFFGWWSAFGPGNLLADMAARGGWTGELRQGVLAASLSLWAAPLSAWCVVLWPRGEVGRGFEAARLDGARVWARLRLRWERDAAPLAAGALATTLVLWGDTSAFDLAQVRTIGFELRTLDALGMSASGLLAVAWPALVPAMLATGGAVVLALRWRRSLEDSGAAIGAGACQPTRASQVFGWVVLAGAVLPLVSLLLRVLGESVGWSSLHARGAGGTVLVALLSGALGVAVALGQFSLAANRRRGTALLLCVMWLLWASLPATLTALGVVGSIGRAGRLLPDAMIVAAGELARFGVVAAGIGTLAGERFARLRDGAGDLARLEATSLVGWLRAAWPSVRWVIASSFMCVALLSAGEMAMAARVSPAGFELLAPSLLSALHYQEPGGIVATLPALAVLAALGVWAMRSLARRTAAGVALPSGIMALLLVGCGDRADSARTTPLPVDIAFGSPGRVPGTFDYPRALDFLSDGSIVVIDKAAQVQVFDSGGRLQRHWMMPESVLGKPTGVSIAPNGEIWVADTHYHRVVRYKPDGTFLGEFGSYGEEPGQFIYPTDIAFGADGRAYVAEYGGNDRIQVFDSTGRLCGSFGRRGTEPGQFSRPQSLAFSPDGSELAIADACNHRVVITDPDGAVLRTIGAPGRAAGQLAYPYSVLWFDEHTLLVSEWGNNRLQMLDARSGAGQGLWGGGGAGLGQLIAPWAIAQHGGRLAILDSGHSRVALLDAASLTRK